MDSQTRKKQRVRMTRLGMSVVSQCVTLLMVSFAWYQSYFEFSVVWGFIILTAIINSIFFLIFYFNLNLKFEEKSLTRAQMVATLLPAAWAVYNLDDGQARASIIFIAIVSALYGIFSLNTQKFLTAVSFYVLAYAGVIIALWINKPHVVDLPLEMMQAFTFMLVMMQIAVLGGYISGLKTKLRKKNTELNDTMKELKVALEQIQTLANTDELTGIDNRRSVLESLDQEVRRVSRTKLPFCIAMLDLDYFKSINDNYGHHAGDEVLKSVATSVKKVIRDVDRFGRYGGEEFLLIMPQTDEAGAAAVSERIRQCVCELHFPNIGEDFSVSISVGIAEHCENESANETLARADRALYDAKDNGRNQVVINALSA